MGVEHDSRNIEQELASGQSEATPFIALSSVIVVIAPISVVADGREESRMRTATGWPARLM